MKWTVQYTVMRTLSLVVLWRDTLRAKRHHTAAAAKSKAAAMHQKAVLGINAPNIIARAKTAQMMDFSSFIFLVGRKGRGSLFIFH